MWSKTSTINEGDDMSDETVFILPEGYRFDFPEGRDFERDTFVIHTKREKLIKSGGYMMLTVQEYTCFLLI